jgi:cytochrome c556
MNGLMTFRYYFVPIFVFAFTGAVALAHTGATGLVKERMEMMKDIASEMKTISQMTKGQFAFDASKAAASAATIADHARQMPDMFPELPAGGPSEAAPEIWENWDEFVGLTEELVLRAESLARAAESANDAAELRPAFRDLGRTCMACHQDFREAG